MGPPSLAPRSGTKTPPPKSGPRKLDLSLPAKYYQPETDKERLDRIIREAMGRGSGPAGPSPAPVTDSQLTAFVNKLMSIPTEVSVSRGKLGVTISTSGATAEIRKDKHTTTKVHVAPSGSTTISTEKDLGGGMKTKASYEVGGPVQLETSYRDLRWVYSISPERWEMKMSFGETAPDLTKIAEVFSKGEAGLRGMLGAVKDWNIKNTKAFLDRVSGHIEPLKKAVQTAGRLAASRPGISVSFQVSGPMSKSGAGSEKGYQAMAVLTIRF